MPKNAVMFLDEHGYFTGPPPAEPPRPAFRHEAAVSRIVLAVMLALLLLPVSAEGLAALVRYVLR